MEGRRLDAWQTTTLWKELQSRTEEPAPKLRHVLEGVLPEVEQVLDKGDTMPGNFTLHDAEHSLRVANWMADLAGDLLGQLSPHDLAMLLLSAFLHDIGMTPPLGKVRDNHSLLLTGEPGSLNEDEVAELQAWLDDEWDGLVPPIAEGSLTRNELRLADQVIAGYVRHRHNDWSETWIRVHLAGAAEDLYPTWLDDLSLLCKSHHFAVDELKDREFDPRPVGNPPATLHLRYCACLLRIADVLDFDPERTPRILFAHRDVEDSSAIFWAKDHGLSFVHDGDHLVLHAEPPDALTHHAIEITLEGVNHELAGCRRLAGETHFQRMANHEEDLPYRWTLDPSVQKTVEPRDDAYEYIDGTFRPDSKRLLELVGGIELYGSTLASVRELLQNAFDAVREQIARQRLNQPDPSSEETRERLAQVHRVSLRLEQADDGYRLVCTDTGTGMTRDVIRSRFLVGGTSTSHEIRALERACEDRGFSVGRTARFGIGVLSYFLLGSELTVHTRRSVEAGDSDQTGWAFTSTGLDDFGELRRDSRSQAGTEVSLVLRDDVIGSDPAEFVRKLHEYVLKTIRRVPCSFDFETPGFERPTFSRPPGWTGGASDTETLLLASLAPKSAAERGARNAELLPVKELQAFKQRESRISDLRERAKEALNIDVYERRLPHDLGVVRISMGTFDVNWGSSFVYLDLEPESPGVCRLKPFPGSDGCASRGGLKMSWNGMSVQTEGRPGLLAGEDDTMGALIEIDWTSDEAGRLAVHRNSFGPSELAEEAVDWALGELAHARLRHIEEEEGSPLGLLNANLTDSPPAESTPRIWLGAADGGSRALQPFDLPTFEHPGLRDLDKTDLRWKGATTHSIPQMLIQGDDGPWWSIAWYGIAFPPTAVGATDIGGTLKPVMVWDSVNRRSLNTQLPPAASQFPPEWASLISMEFNIGFWGQAVATWNADHPLLRVVDSAAVAWVAETFEKSINPLPHSAELMSVPGRVAAWIIRCLEFREEDLWNGLTDHSPDFLPDAWDLIGIDGDEIVHWEAGEMEQTLTALSRTSWRSYEDSEADREFASRFPPPGDEWWLSYSDGTHQLRPKSRQESGASDDR